ncbi:MULTISPECIES: hypothetical protein [Burkholderia cepacia complex]|uniref:hypothetical protein n=1 Tax=Burkholderia cepacia complex TaxID=87882 RepID=UPI001591B571|nr:MULTISPECIES: hypothetical protein [Burkholderia cepacia complex]HDR9168077.1 hypothetical protein [Burkholderia vietnamiensis]
MKRSIDIQTMSAKQTREVYEEFKQSRKDMKQAIYLLCGGSICLVLTIGFLLALLVRH